MEHISKYAAKRDQKLPSHVAASHAAPPRYLSPDDIVPHNRVKRDSAVVDAKSMADEPAAKRVKPVVDVPVESSAVGPTVDDSCATGLCLLPRATADENATAAVPNITGSSDKPMYGRGQLHLPSTDAKAIAKNLKMAPKKLIKAVGMAIKDWNMIEEVCCIFSV